MTQTIAILGAGAMGSAIGRRLTQHGVRVPTLLAGRSEATRRRAQTAGMEEAAPGDLLGADLILSIVPPAEAVPTARALAAAWAARAAAAPRRLPAFVDCNAVNPATMRHVEAAFAGTGVVVIDGCIIGAPPNPGGHGPAFYVSGDPEGRCAILGSLGLDLRPMAAPLGAASALKMCYAGLTKGLTALGAAMVLAAARNGCTEALRAELGRSQPQILARLETALPDMLPKAYRWVAEMQEIAGFLGPEDPAAALYSGAAALYAAIAADVKGERRLATQLESLRSS